MLVLSQRWLNLLIPHTSMKLMKSSSADRLGPEDEIHLVALLCTAAERVRSVRPLARIAFTSPS